MPILRYCKVYDFLKSKCTINYCVYSVQQISEEPPRKHCPTALTVGSSFFSCPAQECNVGPFADRWWSVCQHIFLFQLTLNNMSLTNALYQENSSEAGGVSSNCIQYKTCQSRDIEER